MAHIIRKRKTIDNGTEHLLMFGDPRGIGAAFPCDENGVIDEAAMTAERQTQLASWRAKGEGRLATFHHQYRQPAVLLCDCGMEVELNGFTCGCPCGRDYNQSGQLLAPRGQWGEDTGETLGEILRIP